MKNVYLKLFTNNKCNLHCKYCQINYSKKVTITDDDVINFIEKNYDYINHDAIDLFGGEPSICYSDKLIEYLLKHFKSLQFTSNLKNIELFLKYKDTNKITINASFNHEIEELYYQNLEMIKDMVTTASYVVTKTNISGIYNFVKKVTDMGLAYKISPEISQDFSGYNLDINAFKNELQKIWDNRLEINMMEYIKILTNQKVDLDYCLSTNLCITTDGLLEGCSHACSYYNMAYNDITVSFGNIFDTKIKDITITYPDKEVYSYDNTNCKDCGICYNAVCPTRCYESFNQKIQPQICQFHRTLKEFSEEYEYKIPINSISLFMTEKCNMRCTYCFEKDFKNQVGNVSNETIKKTIDLLMNDNSSINKKLTFFGGEPTLNIDGLEYAINYYHQLKQNGYKNIIHFDINTNLYHINENLIKVFRKIINIAGLYLSVSMDGIKETHDLNRLDINNNPTYDKIIENVKKLKKELQYKKEHFTICKHQVLTDNTCDKIEDICEQAWKERELFNEFSIVYVVPDKGSSSNVSYKNLENMKKYYDKIKYSNDILEEKKNFILKLLHYLCLDTNTSLYNDNYSVCNVLNDMIAIRANGDILPCHSFFDLINTDEYNNIKIDNINQINDNITISFKNKFFRLIYDKNKLLSNGLLKMYSEHGYECRDCICKSICHICIANLKDFKDGNIIQKKEICDMHLNQANILLKIEEFNLMKKYKELKQEQETKFNDMIEGMIKIGDLVASNREILHNIINSKTEGNDNE